MSAVRKVVVGISLTPGHQGVDIPATFIYDPADPYAVRVVFEGLEPVEWQFARDLLLDGLTERTGAGDVLVQPVNNGHGFRITLNSPFGQAEFQFPTVQVQAFLDQTYQLVPQGKEGDTADAELDGVIKQFLDGEGESLI